MENKKRDDTATLTAEACKCSANYVRQVVNNLDKQKSDKAKIIVATYNNILNAKHKVVEETEQALKAAN